MAAYRDLLSSSFDLVNVDGGWTIQKVTISLDFAARLALPVNKSAFSLDIAFLVKVALLSLIAAHIHFVCTRVIDEVFVAFLSEINDLTELRVTSVWLRQTLPFEDVTPDVPERFRMLLEVVFHDEVIKADATFLQQRVVFP